MPKDNRNEFLDASDSDEDIGRDNDSDDDLQKGGRSAKRRRVQDDEESDIEDASDLEEELEDRSDEEPTGEASGTAEKDDEEPEPEQKDAKTSGKTFELPGVTKPLSKKNLVATEEAIKKSGVVYISRVPPYMTPAKLRSLLEPYGKINRLFLAPEDPQARSRRIRNGGNKKKSFTEGWVEFIRKKDAKKACELLNVGPLIQVFPAGRY
jgi:ESF2/ABP1 family protein